MTDEELLALGNGTYGDIKHFADGGFAWVARMIYTTAIMYGGDECGPADRWCYHTRADAARALAEWDGTGEPAGWHRHPQSGRRVDDEGRPYVAT